MRILLQYSFIYRHPLCYYSHIFYKISKYCIFSFIHPILKKLRKVKKTAFQSIPIFVISSALQSPIDLSVCLLSLLSQLKKFLKHFLQWSSAREKCLYLPSFWKCMLPGCRILDWNFYFSTLKISSGLVCNKKLAIIHTIISLHKIWLYLPAAFKINILSLVLTVWLWTS